MVTMKSQQSLAESDALSDHLHVIDEAVVTLKGELSRHGIVLD